MVNEVEELMAKQWSRYDGQRCGGGSERARQRCNGDGAVLSLVWWVKERQIEGERVRVSKHCGFVSLFSPCWPDQPSRRWRATVTQCARPGHDWPRWLADLNR